MLHEHHDFAKSHGAKEAVVAVNGSLVQLAPGPAEIVDEVDTGRTMLDGYVLTDETSPALAMRKRIAFNGALVVTVIFDAGGVLLDDPRVVALGVPDELAERDETIEGDLSIRIDESLDAIGRNGCMDDGTVEETIRKTIRRVMRHEWGKRPPIEVDIVRLPD
jgi:ribonuclease J